jgi:hypothetical protein
MTAVDFVSVMRDSEGFIVFSRERLMHRDIGASAN